MIKFEKLRLPKWIISRIPFEKEYERTSFIIVLIILFPLVGIGLAWYEFYNPRWVLMGMLISITIMVIVCVFAWWLFLQVDLLKETREELIILYYHADNPKKKNEIKKKLQKLYVFVK